AAGPVDDADVTRRAARQAARECQPETRAAAVRLPANAGIEDPLAVGCRNAGTVVAHDVPDRSTVAADRDANGLSPVPARVLDQRLQDPLDELRVCPDTDRVRRRIRADIEASVACERPVRLDRARSEEHTSELQSPDHLVC